MNPAIIAEICSGFSAPSSCRSCGSIGPAMGAIDEDTGPASASGAGATRAAEDDEDGAMDEDAGAA
jgi:hypothetical protein